MTIGTDRYRDIASCFDRYCVENFLSTYNRELEISNQCQYFPGAWKTRPLLIS